MAISAAYSIDLYAINLKKMNVPERPTQVSAMNYHIRRLTPEGVALKA
jgi:hypothetical protein